MPGWRRQLAALKDFGFKDQITRAVLSIPSNIAEGIEKESKREQLRFLEIAKLRRRVRHPNLDRHRYRLHTQRSWQSLDSNLPATPRHANQPEQIHKNKTK